MELTETQKYALGIVVILLFLAGFWMIVPKVEPPEISPEVVTPSGGKVVVKPQEAELGWVGYGWSVKDTPEEAVQEAVSQMKQRMEGKSPEHVLIFYTVGYDTERIQKELRRLIGSDVQIQGSSSTLGVMSREGYHVGKVGSLAILGINAPDHVNFGVGGADLDEYEPQEAGRKAIQEAIKNSKQEGLPQYIYITAAPGVEEHILPGIEDVVGTDVPVVGGSSGDNDLTGKWSEIANDEVYNNGVVLAAVYTDLKIGTHHEFGYKTTEHRGIATKVDGRKILEIDNRPAADVYDEWTEGFFAEKVQKARDEGEDSVNILAEATFYPIARVVKSEEVDLSYLCVSHPGYIYLEEKSISGFANVEEGDEVVLLHGTWEWLVNRAQSTAHKAMASENIAPGEGFFTFYTFCAGTLLAIPEDERPKVPLLLNQELGGIPFVGGFTLGEQVFMPGIGNRHANLVNSIAIFSG